MQVYISRHILHIRTPLVSKSDDSCEDTVYLLFLVLFSVSFYANDLNGMPLILILFNEEPVLVFNLDLFP